MCVEMQTFSFVLFSQRMVINNYSSKCYWSLIWAFLHSSLPSIFPVLQLSRCYYPQWASERTKAQGLCKSWAMSLANTWHPASVVIMCARHRGTDVALGLLCGLWVPPTPGRRHKQWRGTSGALRWQGRSLRETQGFMKRRGTPLTAKKLKEASVLRDRVNSRCRWKNNIH